MSVDDITVARYVSGCHHYTPSLMARWEPNAAGRLREAALELFEEHGFEGTTVAEIAARAGLTERTFFRHFADKREVLFRGSEGLRDVLVAAVDAAPATAAPLEAVRGALEAAGTAFTLSSPAAATPSSSPRPSSRSASSSNSLRSPRPSPMRCAVVASPIR